MLRCFVHVDETNKQGGHRSREKGPWRGHAKLNTMRRRLYGGTKACAVGWDRYDEVELV